MLRASPPLSAGQASHYYYESEFSRGDYYTERESEGIVASRWHGHGAHELGLSGRVKAEEFTRLLAGRDPSGRRVLVARREGKDERRAGWDVTISPHKSVSLQALVGGDGRLLEAHDRAVSKTVSELERHVQAWVRGGRDVETTGVVIGASFRHETSRALDPQVHSHRVLLNVTRRADGEWRAVNARGMFRAQSLAREIDGLLPWGHIDNRPFRCMHGFGLCLWRPERFEEAADVFDRMLWLNPSDNQGIRFLVDELRSRKRWGPGPERRRR